MLYFSFILTVSTSRLHRRQHRICFLFSFLYFNSTAQLQRSLNDLDGMQLASSETASYFESGGGGGGLAAD